MKSKGNKKNKVIFHAKFPKAQTDFLLKLRKINHKETYFSLFILPQSTGNKIAGNRAQ